MPNLLNVLNFLPKLVLVLVLNEAQDRIVAARIETLENATALFELIPPEVEVEVNTRLSN